MSSADEAGAFAFVRNYFADLQAAFATGNVEPLKPLRRDSCRCVRFEQEIREVYGKGGHIDGETFQVVEVLAGQTGPAFTKVTAGFRSSAYTTVLSDGRKVAGIGAQGDYYFLLVREGDHWIIDTFLGNARPRSS